MNKFSKKFIHHPNLQIEPITDVAKLVDALDLGPSNFCCESSSLSIRIMNDNHSIPSVG